jgi:hypothetical protein
MSLSTRWLECGICKHWTGYFKLNFKTTRSLFLKELKFQVQDNDPEMVHESHPVVAAVCPPCELENIVNHLKQKYTKQEAALIDDDELDDPECGMGKTDTSSSSSADDSCAKPSCTQELEVPAPITEKAKAVYDDDLHVSKMARSSSNKIPVTKMYRLADHRPMNLEALWKGVPCSHYRRDTPPVVHSHSAKRPPRMVESGFGDTYMLAKPILEDWLGQRSDMTNVLAAPKLAAYPWAPGQKEVLNPALHSQGKWFWCGVIDNKWIPPAPHGTDVDCRPRLDGHGFDTMIHTSNMYILHKAVIGGLEPGKEEGKGGMVGVYAYRPIGNKTALQSCGYAVYSDLAMNGLYFSPRFELAVNTKKAEWNSIKIAAGNQQYCLRKGLYHITGVWIHCLTGNDVMDGMNSWTCLDDWHPGHELETPRRSQVAAQNTGDSFQ